jgi:hypothetical protein
MFGQEPEESKSLGRYRNLRVIEISFLSKKFWEELIGYFPMIRHEARIKRRAHCCVCIY